MEESKQTPPPAEVEAHENEQTSEPPSESKNESPPADISSNEEPEKKKRKLTEKQLEALKNGRAKRWAKKAESKEKPKRSKEDVESDSTVGNYSSDSTSADEKKLPKSKPKLKRQKKHYSSDSSSSESEGWMTPPPTPPQPRKSKNKKRIEKRVEKYLNRYLRQGSQTARPPQENYTQYEQQPLPLYL
mmetsp:Transcript_11105/g.14498  ORF Transcript_11105/g.14498 Transcript_11105/m.14498 type:complete len:188 (-) Transcript_11105:155-718(-)